MSYSPELVESLLNQMENIINRIAALNASIPDNGFTGV